MAGVGAVVVYWLVGPGGPLDSGRILVIPKLGIMFHPSREVKVHGDMLVHFGDWSLTDILSLKVWRGVSPCLCPFCRAAWGSVLVPSGSSSLFDGGCSGSLGSGELITTGSKQWILGSALWDLWEGPQEFRGLVSTSAGASLFSVPMNSCF